MQQKKQMGYIIYPIWFMNYCKFAVMCIIINDVSNEIPGSLTIIIASIHLVGS